MRIDGGVFNVKSTCGDTHLGGEDFDQRIVEALADGFQEAHKVDLPALAGGHMPIGRELQMPDGASRNVLAHAHVRGDEVVLVLLSLEP